MLRGIMKPEYRGNVIEFHLTKWGYRNYSVECTYHFDKQAGKYMLSIWLKRSDLDDRMHLSSKKTDSQYISGTKETIVENICRIVHQACISGYFQYFIERYEYELACFERGNELFEQERITEHDKETDMETDMETDKTTDKATEMETGKSTDEATEMETNENTDE